MTAVIAVLIAAVIAVVAGAACFPPVRADIRKWWRKIDDSYAALLLWDLTIDAPRRAACLACRLILPAKGHRGVRRDTWTRLPRPRDDEPATEWLSRTGRLAARTGATPFTADDGTDPDKPVSHWPAYYGRPKTPAPPVAASAGQAPTPAVPVPPSGQPAAAASPSGGPLPLRASAPVAPQGQHPFSEVPLADLVQPLAPHPLQQGQPRTWAMLTDDSAWDGERVREVNPRATARVTMPAIALGPDRTQIIPPYYTAHLTRQDRPAVAR